MAPSHFDSFDQSVLGDFHESLLHGRGLSIADRWLNIGSNLSLIIEQSAVTNNKLWVAEHSALFYKYYDLDTNTLITTLIAKQSGITQFLFPDHESGGFFVTGHLTNSNDVYRYNLISATLFCAASDVTLPQGFFDAEELGVTPICEVGDGKLFGKMVTYNNADVFDMYFVCTGQGWTEVYRLNRSDEGYQEQFIGNKSYKHFTVNFDYIEYLHGLGHDHYIFNINTQSIVSTVTPNYFSRYIYRNNDKYYLGISNNIYGVHASTNINSPPLIWSEIYHESFGAQGIVNNVEFFGKYGDFLIGKGSDFYWSFNTAGL